jgi:hypothetical protein
MTQFLDFADGLHFLIYDNVGVLIDKNPPEDYCPGSEGWFFRYDEWDTWRGPWDSREEAAEMCEAYIKLLDRVIGGEDDEW